MARYNPDKKIKIEINKCTNPAYDYSIWDVRDKNKSRCIVRNTEDSYIIVMLTEAQYKQFEQGKFTFLVPASALMDHFQYMY